ncbi:unnamed protein product [Effrenium voratum]|nr:unnamed protein product [Effrenium voratum]
MPVAPTRPATVFNWTHRNQAQHLAEQDRKAREEKEAAAKREREEALKRAESQMTDMERQQAEKVARFRVTKAIETVRNSPLGPPREQAAEEMRLIMTEWLPKVALDAQQDFLEQATNALVAKPPSPAPVAAPSPAVSAPEREKEEPPASAPAGFGGFGMDSMPSLPKMMADSMAMAKMGVPWLRGSLALVSVCKDGEPGT